MINRVLGFISQLCCQANRPDPWWPLIKLTCQIFLTHPVVDFFTLVFAPSSIGPRWPHNRGQPRWFSADRPDPCWPVIKLTCQIFPTQPVADFFTLAFAPSPIGTKWPHPRGQQRLFSAYRPDPWGPVIKLTCQIFLTHEVTHFCTLGFAPSPI